MARPRWCSILPVLVVACGGGDKTKPKPEAPLAPPPAPAIDAAAPAIDAAAAPVATGATCEPASFARTGACDGGGKCVSLYEIDRACVVQRKKELPFMEPDIDILDVAWPQLGGPLYVVVSGQPGGAAWGALEAPLTAADDALDKLAWNVEKIGDVEPEGFRFGVETTSDGAVLTTCKKWISDNEEEWHCDEPRSWSIATKAFTKKLGQPPFTKPIDGTPLGKITLKKTKQGLACTGADGKTVTIEVTPQDPPIVGAVSLSDDTYLLVQYNQGSRMSANPAAYATVMRGCEEHPLKGEAIAGPAGYWLHRADRHTAGKEAWHVYRNGDATPLVGADGKPFGTPGDVVTWAVP